MPVYDTELRQDSKGRYFRSLGRKLDRSGKTKPHLFRLGRDEGEARVRRDRLQQLWSQVEANAQCKEAAIWDAATLGIGKAIAQGKAVYQLPFPEQSASPSDADCQAYAYLVDTHATKFRMIAIVPDNTEIYRRGKALDNQQIEDLARTASQRFAVENILDAETRTIYAALDEYIEYLKSTTIDPDTKVTTAWGHVQAKQAGRLKERLPDDFPLHQLTLHKIKEIILFWRNRPQVKGKATPMARDTVKSHIKQFKHFLWWLHDHDEYRWKMPSDIARVATSPQTTSAEKSKRSRPNQVVTLPLEDLVILYKYSTPLIRLYVLLGMNCGFGPAEFGTLRLDEIYLYQAHGYDDRTDFQTTEAMSWIKRGRWKTGIYGEWLLWPETVKGIEWAIERRKEHPGFSDDALMFLTQRGLPYHGQTIGGNNNSRIGNAWWRTIDRIQKDYPAYKRYAPKLLRKTSGNRVRNYRGGEVMSIFHSRGKTVDVDDLADFYSDRPFRFVFEAIQDMHEWLRPMFDAVNDPFPEIVKKGGSNITLGQAERILELHGQGVKAKDIARQVGVTASTVYRHLAGDTVKS